MTEQVRRALAHLARQRQWDAASLYALVSLATGGTCRTDAGVDGWTPAARVGLLGWTEGQATSLGVTPSPHPPRASLPAGAWATWTIAAMSLADQIALVERTLLAAGLGDAIPKRPVGYLLAARAAAPSLPDQTRLGSDANRRTVGELAGELEQEAAKIAKAQVSPKFPLFEACWAAFLFVVVRRF